MIGDGVLNKEIRLMNLPKETRKAWSKTKSRKLKDVKSFASFRRSYLHVDSFNGSSSRQNSYRQIVRNGAQGGAQGVGDYGYGQYPVAGGAYGAYGAIGEGQRQEFGAGFGAVAGIGK